jgi:molybdopterin-guanine dinucleotide biosynthesis protein A
MTMDGLILAGGENKRIPVTKGFLTINGLRIIDGNLERLRAVFDRVMISTNEPERYFSLCVSLVGDVISDRGPMTGIFSTLIGRDCTEVFVTACDMPFINVILVKRMVDSWDNKKWDAVVPIFEAKPQPLLGIYSRKIAKKMEKSIQRGKRSLRDFLQEINVRYISEEEVRSIDREGRSFVNINTLEDFHREGGTICLA